MAFKISGSNIIDEFFLCAFDDKIVRRSNVIRTYYSNSKLYFPWLPG